ncbi:NSFL1 cofactor p47-like [Mizuhopecten yessoensis]|uniref:NSFL1 cofactor p47 n=1 Tax=Mizuhopecten yessoensis TaxID=6573 RepID=A0A210R1M1_MIZYE|nr:NSFL1 cofactor p47-like [Mizuhopecten yessoensis]OWF54902.1 NSFL1 cofactor p47 [Mizuhopecten yessoensis]
MADNVQKEEISKFIQLTGADSGRAKFYLESSNWNYEVAVASFFDNDDGDEDLYEAPVAEPAPLPPKPTQPTNSSAASFPPASTRPSRFATLGSYQDRENSSSSDDEGQAFYAGGSETSGQQIIGPKKREGKKVVDNLFKSAREHGAEEVDRSEKKPLKSMAFKGSGYRLGETEDGPADIVQGAPLQSGPRQVDMVLKLWKDGFSVDNGELRDFQSPANKEFLDSVAKGEVPQELIKLARGGEVNLNMEDHRQEAFVKSKEATKAFSGQGNLLGSPAPNIAPAAAGSAAAAAASQSSVAVDGSRPTTSLQIRLADGSRMVAKFNHTHRISDIRQHIIANNPRYAGANFILMTTFPNKELSDESLTLDQGKLLNAVIVQRLK